MIVQFFKPETVEEAVKIKNELKDQALYFAGGTEINSRLPEDVNKKAVCTELLGLDKINKTETEISIGSAVTMQDLINSGLVPEILKKASKYMVNRNIRNMATIGGNICTNKSCSTLIPVLIALNAKLKTAAPGGENITDVFKYSSGEKDDLITEIIIPVQNHRTTEINRFTRTSNDLSIINTAVSFEKSGKGLKETVIALGGVDKHVVRLTQTEEMLDSSSGLPEKKAIENEVIKSIKPIDDLRGSAGFKSYLAGVMVADCIYSAYEKEGKSDES
jgi:putative selenate reductase FAD-binding subunit